MAELLVVDDDLDVCWLLEEILQVDGHRVRVAHDGEEGLSALLDQRCPDAIVLDVEMPKLDGPEMAYRLLLHNAGLDTIPIVLVSGCQDLPKIARRVGTPYYLAKPFDVTSLLKLVTRAVAERLAPRPSP